MSTSKYLNVIKKPSQQPLPVIEDGEELPQTQEFDAPQFGESTREKPSFMSKKTDGTRPTFLEKMKQKKLSAPVEFDEPVTQEEEIPDVKDLCDVKSIKQTAKPRMHQDVIEKNAKPSVKLNATKSQSQSKYPYLIMAAEYDNDTVYLWDVDSSRIQLRYSGDIEVEIGGHTLTKRDIDGHKGYIFFKGTKTHVDKLDELFQSEWRKFLQVPLPEIVERDPSLLWEGQLNGKDSQLFDYSEKAVVLFTDEDFSKFVSSKEWMENRYTHPTRGKVQGYCIGKRGKGIDRLREIIPENFGMKYTKSAPVNTAPLAQHHLSLLDRRNVQLEDKMYELSVYDYTEPSFALIFTPDFVFEEEDLIRNETLNINGKRLPGYIFSKTNKAFRALLEELAPGIILETKKPEIVEDPSLMAKIPKVNEDKVEDLIIKLFAKMSKVDDTTTRRIETKGKLILYGNMDSASSQAEEMSETYEQLFMGQVSETCGFYLMSIPK